MIAGVAGERSVFRVQGSRIYYVRESLANLATSYVATTRYLRRNFFDTRILTTYSVARDNLLSLGTCVGKFTKTGKCRLHITVLDLIAPICRSVTLLYLYSQRRSNPIRYKIWIKPNGEVRIESPRFRKTCN